MGRMPRVYRTMYAGNDGLPEVGDWPNLLGVRPPGRTKADGRPELSDVDLSDDGHGVLNGKGMSVFRSTADLRRMMPHLVPKHLAWLVRNAAAPDGARVWSTGEGPFVSGPLTDEVLLSTSGGRHGTVCPRRAMPLDTFGASLAATRAVWRIDEPVTGKD